MANEKILALLSGGLDSRVIAKLLQKQGYSVVALHFKLPFSKDVEKSIVDFCEENHVELHVLDYTKGKLLREYMKMLASPKFGRGTGVNPCMDCKILMLNKAKKFADEKGINFIATGEVTGQRPMSQHASALNIVVRESGLKDRIKRPLIEMGIEGRKRHKQIALAKDFGISYPDPAGGCLLCEKNLRERFKFLMKRGISDKELKLVIMGRHFAIDNSWIILGRDAKDNALLEKCEKLGKLITPESLGFEIGPDALIIDKKPSKELEEKVKKLIIAYSKQGSLESRKEFEKYKL